jgi:hypothetical protein
MLKKMTMITLTLMLFACSNNEDTTENPTPNAVSELFGYKFDDASGTSFVPRLVKVNQNNGTETDLIQTTLGETIYGFVFNKGTNEIIGIGDNNKLIKFNLTTNTYTSVSLNLTGDFGYEDLIIDNNNNLYAFKFDDAIGTSYVPRLVKVNTSNGTDTDLIQTTLGETIYGFVFNKGTNEIIGIGDNNKLIKFNLTTNTYTSVSLNLTGDFGYEDLIIDNNNNLYAYKFDDAIGTSYIPRLVKINQTNGTATDLIQTTLGESIYGFEFNKDTNEIIGIGDNNKLIKFNLNTNTYTSVSLNLSGDFGYEDLIIN